MAGVINVKDLDDAIATANDTRFGLPQSMVDYLNQGLPDIYQNIYKYFSVAMF